MPITASFSPYTGALPIDSTLTPEEFVERAEYSWTWISTDTVPNLSLFITQANALEVNVNAKEVSANNSASSASSNASLAQSYSNSSLASKNAIEGYVIPTSATYSPAEINDKFTETSNLFTLLATPQAINTVGVKAVQKVVTVADVSGSLNNTYFRINATPTTDAYISNPVNVDVWFNVGGAGTVPASGASRYIAVAIASNATNTAVATALQTAIDADTYLNAVVVDNEVTIVHTLSGLKLDIVDFGTLFTMSNVTTGSGFLSGTEKWAGGVLATNGKIYGIPFNSTQVLEIDPVTKTTSLFGSLSGSTKWDGGVLAPNGKIYGIPRNSTQVLEIDPIAKTTSLFGSLSGTDKWFGGVLAPNGKIYGIPFNSTQVLEIDPIAKTTTLFGSLSGSNKWIGGVLAPNGKIYGMPRNSTQVLEIDPITKTTTLFGSLSVGDKWRGGVLAPNGKIYGIPLSSTQVLEISTTDEIPKNYMLSAYCNKF